MTLIARKTRCPHCGHDPAGDAEFLAALSDVQPKHTAEPVARIDSPVRRQRDGLYRAEVTLTRALSQFTDLYLQAPAAAPDIEAAWADLRKEFPPETSGWTVGDACNFRVMFERGFRAALKGIQAPAVHDGKGRQ